MGRWKDDGSGNAVYDANDSGPDQINKGQPPPTAGAQPSASSGPASPWSNPDEANFGQTLTRFQNDYHSDDRDAVLKQMGDWAGQSSGQNTGVNGGNTGTPVDRNTTGPGAPVGGSQPNYGAAPPGFDQAKWGDPSQGTSNKYQVGRILAGGGSIQDAAKAVGAKVISPDKIQYPDGFIADVYFDYGGPQQRVQYTDVTGESGGAAGAAGSGGGLAGQGGPGGLSGYAGMTGQGGQGFAGVGGSSGGSYYSGNIGAFSNPRSGPLYDMLMGRATQGLNVNARDPIIANQVDSYRAEQQRGANNSIDAQAEAQGPYANLTSERRLANEHAAQATGGLQAQLVGQELTARRTEIQNALSQMGSMLTSEQQLALQQQLGMIDAALRQQGITNQNNQFLDDLGLRAEHESSYWDDRRRNPV